MARDPDNLVLSDVYVNPVPGFRTGRGVLVEGATGAVHIARSRVDSVYGFGIRVVDAGSATIAATAPIARCLAIGLLFMFSLRLVG